MSRKSHVHRVGSNPRRREASSRRRKSRATRWRSAATSDPLELYELSVQEPSAECDFIDQVWREKRGAKRRLRAIREDFCGSAIVSAEWVRRHRDNTAVGVDLDEHVLNWT